MKGDFKTSASYRKNERIVAGPGQERCAVCAKPLSMGNRKSIQLYAGGSRWADTDEELDENDPGYMGIHDVGSACLSRLHKAAKS